MDKISHSQFAELTGINRRHIWLIIQGLIEKELVFKSITQKGDGVIVSYGIRKNYDKWKVSPKKVTVTKKGDSGITQKGDGVSRKKVTKVSRKKVHTIDNKDNIKNTIKNKEIFSFLKDNSFSTTYQHYLQMRKSIRKPATARAEELVLKKLHKYDIQTAIAILEQSIVSSWQDVYPLRKEKEDGRIYKSSAERESRGKQLDAIGREV